MTPYIDGFVFPISSKRISEYKQVAQAVAKKYYHYGAIEYREFQGDDLMREGTLPFPAMTDANSDETIIFGWIAFESRESRDHINTQIESDPEMADIVGPLMNPENPIFNPLRMAYGGFRPLVAVAKQYDSEK